jgi:hypothetical protein
MADGAGRVPVLGPEKDHFWLVQRMAKATGVDLVKAWDSGILTADDWAGIVTRCRGCSWTDGCDRFLDTPNAGNRAAPEPCLNHKRLARIKATLEELEDLQT